MKLFDLWKSEVRGIIKFLDKLFCLRKIIIERFKFNKMSLIGEFI